MFFWLLQTKEFVSSSNRTKERNRIIDFVITTVIQKSLQNVQIG